MSRRTDMSAIAPGSAGAAVVAAWESRGVTQTAYAEHAGISKVSAGDRLRAENMGAARLADMLAFAGYELVAVPVGTRLPDEARVIEPGGRA